MKVRDFTFVYPMKHSLAYLGLCLPLSSMALDIDFADFSSVAGLQINGNAAQVGNVLRLVPALDYQSDSAFSSSALSLNNLSSFSTYFSFQLSNPGGISDNDGIGADGLVFVVQTVANNVGGAGGGLGYSGIQNSVGVEFDSWDNGMGIGDPNGNHVAVDFNGDLSTPIGTTPVPTRLNDGQIWHAWVDYDGSVGSLEVRLSGVPFRPPVPLIDVAVDLGAVLGQPEVFVGFTAGTGAAWGDHDILSWKFASEYLPINVPDSGASLPALVAGCFGLRGLVRRRR